MNTPPQVSFDSSSSTAESPDLIHRIPVLVLFPHNRCNCRCVMCDIWRIRQTREITLEDLELQMPSLLTLQVRWVVFSGGEPQMHSHLSSLSGLLRRSGVRVTLLTAGLLLERYASSVVESIDDVIVSLDGPPEIHNRIRRIPRAFELLARGIDALRRLRPGMVVRGRCTVQKANCCELRKAVLTGRQIGLNSISFLAADLGSEAFNRQGGWPAERQEMVALTAEEVDLLSGEIEALIKEHEADIAAGYVVETAQKLRRIVYHFRAHLGEVPATAPRCNAPWVSAVIEADGTVRPCFFHRPLGNIHERSLLDVLNGDEAVRFRKNLNIAKNPVCQRCVCSLYLPEERIVAMEDR